MTNEREPGGSGAANQSGPPTRPDGPLPSEAADVWAALLARARLGDAAAFGVLLQRVLPKLEIAAARSLGERLRASTRASDVLQDALVDVVRRLDDFSGNTEAMFVSWVQRIIQNSGRQTYRRLMAQKRRPPDAGAPFDEPAGPAPTEPRTPSSFVERAEDWVQYELALADLGTDQRHVIQQVILGGRSVAEVAHEMGRSEAAAYGLLTRARAALAIRLRAKRPLPPES